MTRLRHAVLIAACLGLLAGVQARAQTPAAPGRDKLDDTHFAPDWDALCAGGADLGQGCERVRARRVADAAAAPWRAVGRVNFASTRIRGHCTGTLVGERLVATAAHCLYNRARKTWIPAESIRFAAGYQRGESVALSRVARYLVDPVADPTGREFSADPWQDWALLVLEEPVGREAGWITPGTIAPEALAATELVFAGYAGLRPHVLTVAGDCGAAGYLGGGAFLVQSCPVMHGDSGGPILAGAGDELALVGVLSVVFRDGAAVASGAVPVSAFADALRREGAELAGPPAAPGQ